MRITEASYLISEIDDLIDYSNSMYWYIYANSKAFPEANIPAYN